MAEVYRFARKARRPAGIGLIGMALAGIAALMWLGASPIIVGGAGLAVAPAVWEVIRNTQAALELDPETLRWESGKRRGEIPLEQIEEVVVSTTLDLSTRATARLTSGAKLRLPMECLPPRPVLEAELGKRGVPTRRAMFAA